MSRRKKKKPSSKCPEPFNTLIDLAAAATMDYIFYKRRQKRGGKKRGKIDPYTATGAAMGMGLIDDTEDLIRFGGMLGAMGAFDPDEPDEVYQSSYAGPHDSNPFYAPKNNKYAWRLNCEDGSEYGISPEDYETRDEYHDALHREKNAWRDSQNDGNAYEVAPEDIDLDEDSSSCLEETADGLIDTKATDTIFNKTVEQPTAIQPTPEDKYEDDDFAVFIYCKVETENGIDYYRTENTKIKKGDTVTVPWNGFIMSGKILSVERHMRFSVPKPISETYLIIE